MKKRNLFVACLATIGILIASVVVPKSKILVSGESKNHPDCETLSKNMPSISDVILNEYNNSNNGKTLYSTWGTVTSVYTQNSFYHAYIQNRVEGKNSGALCLYKIGPTSSASPVNVGDFVTVEGYLSYYNGTYEIDMTSESSELTHHYDIESYPVVSETLSVDRLTAKPGSTGWTQNICAGNIRVSLKNAEIVKAGSSYTMVRINGDSNQIKLYYGGINDAASIFNTISKFQYDHANINVTGYLSAYDLKGKEETELLIRNSSDIENTQSYVPVTDLVFYSLQKEMEVGDQSYVSYEISPRGATNKTVIWNSTNPEIATVDQDGLITAISEGYATIIGTSADNSALYDTCSVIVEGSNDGFVEVTSIEIDLPGTPDGYISETPYFYKNIGDTGSISYTVYPTNATDKSVRFVSNNHNVVEVDEYSGEWEIVGSGMAEIFVVSNSNYSVEAYYSIICISQDNSKLFRICFEESQITVGVGETIDVPFVTVPENYDTSKLTCESIYGKFEVLGIEGHNIKIKGKTVFDSDILNLCAPNNEVERAQISVEIINSSGSSSDVILRQIDVGSFSTNFGIKKHDGTGLKYAYYRAGKSSDGIKLYPSVDLVNASSISLPGSFSNETAKNAFTSIDVTYSGAGTLRYGETKDCTNSYNLPSSSSDKTITVNTNDAYFFYVEADKGETLDLIKLSFKLNTSKSFNSTIQTNSRVNTRIPATVYSGTLTPGVSYVDVPTDVSISGNSYTVKTTKRYTYYTFDYVQQHKDELNLEEIALTDPVDIANYFIAFHCAPVNYISMNGHELDKSVGVDSLGSQTDVQQMFGNKARYVSKYSKTSGYAIGIPYYGSTPTYLEFDFDGNGKYSLNSRDVCRVVLWASGWEGTGYGANIPVATYTDDHYVTFREYNNYGGWNLPFDTKENGNYTQLRTNYYYGSTNTLVKQ